MGPRLRRGATVLPAGIELGITSWDTANVYGYGSSEEIVGRALKKYARRDDIVLAATVRSKMHEGPGGSGLSRKAIMEPDLAQISAHPLRF